VILKKSSKTEPARMHYGFYFQKRNQKKIWIVTEWKLWSWRWFIKLTGGTKKTSSEENSQSGLIENAGSVIDFYIQVELPWLRREIFMSVGPRTVFRWSTAQSGGLPGVARGMRGSRNVLKRATAASREQKQGWPDQYIELDRRRSAWPKGWCSLQYHLRGSAATITQPRPFGTSDNRNGLRA